MKTCFKNDLHRERFLALATEDNMHPGDYGRASLFFLLSGNDDLYKKRRHIYDTGRHGICRCLENAGVDFSSSARSLIRLGFNLYNNWSDEYTTPWWILGRLDQNNLWLAERAVRIRFSPEFLATAFP